MKITISKENYLKTIAEAESEGEPVIAATLARWLNVSAPFPDYQQYAYVPFLMPKVEETMPLFCGRVKHYLPRADP
ncbi:MAG TPA: hypothetical protein VEV17_05305 [Bryobacteraceae bacterium]|nr:hypothetical protein [Bryobacteraceae bacterium]